MTQVLSKTEICFEESSVEDFIPFSHKTVEPIFVLREKYLGKYIEVPVYHARTHLDPTGSMYILNINGYDFHIPGNVSTGKLYTYAFSLLMKLVRSRKNMDEAGGVEFVKKKLASAPSTPFNIKETSSKAGLCDLGIAGFIEYIGAQGDVATWGDIVEASKFDERVFLVGFVAIQDSFNSTT